MASPVVVKIEKGYGVIDSFDPIISFGDNDIQFESKLTFIEVLYAFAGFLALLIPILIVHSVWMTIFFTVVQLYYIYELIMSIDVVRIDFLNNEIQIKNPISLVNYIRRVLKKPIKISFQDISTFKNYRRPTNWLKKRSNILVVKLFDHSPIKIIKFRFEKDSMTMAVLLNQYIVGKPGIIE